MSCLSPWTLDATLLLALTKAVDVPPVAKLLPAGLHPVIVPSPSKVWTNASVVWVHASKFDTSPVGPYSALVVAAQAHHAQSNTTGWYPVAAYSDSAAASQCLHAGWGLPLLPAATFAWKSDKSVLGMPYDEVEVKVSSSVFAKSIASLSNYYNKSISPPPAPANGSCIEPIDARNCTEDRPHLLVRNGSLLTWRLQTTGPIMPSLGALKVGSGAGVWSSLGVATATAPIPSQLTSRQAEARGAQTPPKLICEACMPPPTMTTTS